MQDYEHSEIRSPWWRLIKANPKSSKTTTSSNARLRAFRNKISIVKANRNHIKIMKKHYTSDARLWAFRNKISMVEAAQDHFKIIKNTTSSDARP